MPIVNMSQDVLLNAVNRGAAAPLAVADLRKTITAIGTEVEEVAVMQQFICRRCGRLIERSEAQGVPVECPQCHADFRGAGAADCERRGENTVVRLNMVAARPDVFDPGGMARCIRGYLEIETGLREYPAAPPTIRVTVDPRLADEKSFRPCIACAVLRDVALDDEHIKILMNLQENLHWALGRDRKLASIGAYDLDTLHGREFRYDAVEPSELRFVPLGFDPTKPDTLLTPAEILQKHGTGMTYARLLAGFDQYPLLRDEKGVVLSMPPIINSEQTRVTAKTRNLFIDVTGPGQRIVDRALNVLVSGLRELLPQIRIEQVTVRTADGRERVTPDFTPSRMRISCREVAETIGVPLDRSAVGRLLERMGHRVAPDADADALLVDTPAYRNDIMHPIDLVEDAAVAYGFDNLPAELVPTFTVGQARQTEERSALARRALTGLGFHQVMTLGLTSEPAAFDKLRIPQDAKRHAALLAQAVRIENPISVEQTICRVMLLPGLLETFAINKQHDLPQNLFEGRNRRPRGTPRRRRHDRHPRGLRRHPRGYRQLRRRVRPPRPLCPHLAPELHPRPRRGNPRRK
jgi:phenylalanyl-tRNA synthetase beta chain